MKSVSTYEKLIKKCLEHAGRYTPALDLNIYALASTLRTHELIMRQVDGLRVTVLELTTARGKNVRAHPLLGQLRDAEASVLRQLRELGLTAEGTRGRVEADPLAGLLAGMRGATTGRGKVVSPD